MDAYETIPIQVHFPAKDRIFGYVTVLIKESNGLLVELPGKLAMEKFFTRTGHIGVSFENHPGNNLTLNNAYNALHDDLYFCLAVNYGSQTMEGSGLCPVDSKMITMVPIPVRKILACPSVPEDESIVIYVAQGKIANSYDYHGQTIDVVLKFQKTKREMYLTRVEFQYDQTLFDDFKMTLIDQISIPAIVKKN